MSLLVIEGFDHYDESTYTGKVTLDSRATINTTGGRFTGSGALRPSDGVTEQANYIAFGSNNTEVIVGFGFKVAAGASESLYPRVCGLQANDGKDQVVLKLGSGNVLYVTRGDTTTVIANGSQSLSKGHWYFIEFRAKIDNSSGEVEVRIDGVADISVTGTDTQYSASISSVDKLYFDMGGYQETYIDDVYILNKSGSVNNDFLGDCRVDTLFPDADGTTNDWTASGGGNNYADVDEDPPDGDTSYVESGSDGDIDLYDHVDLAQATSVYGVQVSAYAKRTDANLIYARLGVRVSGANYWGTTEGLGIGYSFIKELFEENPATSSAWTRTTVNAAEMGIQRVAPLTTPAPTTLTSSPPTTAGSTTAAPTTLATTAAPTTLASTAAPTTAAPTTT